jgi:metallo-beta-lactamase class B
MPLGVPLVLLALGASAGGAAPPPPPGSLDKEVIRGVIRSHVGEVKDCYERELDKAPDLFGRVMVRFTIAASGEVTDSALESSTIRSLPVEACTVAAVRRWRFPKPEGGGIVIVSYPFVLVPEQDAIPIGGTAETGPITITVLDTSTVVHTTTNAQGVPSNGLVVLTERGLLLVDTAWTDAQTEAILKWGDARLGRPWLGAVITHDHADRDGGLGALQRRHIPVAALDLTVAKLGKRGVRGVDTLFTARAGVFKDPRGFEAFYPGPGHASDNIVLSFPGALYGGCLVKSTMANDLGFTGDADLAHWADAIRRVAQRYKKQGLPIVPGHGQVDPTADPLQRTLDLLAARAKR